MIRNSIIGLMAGTSGLAYAAAGEEGGRPKPGQHQTSEVETGSGQSGFSGSIAMDVGGDEVTVSEVESTTDHIEVGNGAEAAEDGPAPDADNADDKAEGEGDDDGDQQDEGEGDDTTPVELPEFKADDAEAVAVYEKTFKNAEGKLNLEALSANWWANAQAAEDNKGHLDEGVYAYLDSIGIPKELVQFAEEGQQALNNQSTQALYTRAGGKANLDAAIKWATDKTSPAYTEAQRDAFNKAVAAGGESAADAIDLLMSRFEKTTQKRVSPAKSAGEHSRNGGAGGGGQQPDVFETRADWLAARKAAGRDVNKQAAVSAKYRRSPNAGNW